MRKHYFLEALGIIIVIIIRVNRNEPQRLPPPCFCFSVRFIKPRSPCVIAVPWAYKPCSQADHNPTCRNRLSQAEWLWNQYPLSTQPTFVRGKKKYPIHAAMGPSRWYNKAPRISDFAVYRKEKSERVRAAVHAPVCLDFLKGVRMW